MTVQDPSLIDYQYRGARALVLLHEKHLLSFLETWRLAKRAGVILPETEDPDYESMETLLAHVLGAARGYMVWICEQLRLPDPGIHASPSANEVTAAAEAYVKHLLERWRVPLAQVPEELFHKPSYKSRWGVEYCVDAMLEHAVMHPIRHAFQLQEALNFE